MEMPFWWGRIMMRKEIKRCKIQREKAENMLIQQQTSVKHWTETYWNSETERWGEWEAKRKRKYEINNCAYY